MTKRVFQAFVMCVCAIVLTACDTFPLGNDRAVPAQEATVARTAVSAGYQPTQRPIRPAGTYRVKAGDRLSIYVFDNPDLVQSVVVGPDGKFNYPLVGSVQASGQTLLGIDATLTRRLGQNILQPEVTVTLFEVASRQVFITGEVLAPGVFSIAEPVSVVQAISMAGGFTAFANRTNIIVYNPGRSTDARRVFNYDAFLANPTGYDIALRPGDTVIVQ